MQFHHLCNLCQRCHTQVCTVKIEFYHYNNNFCCLTPQRRHLSPLTRSVRFGVRNIKIPNGVFIDYFERTVIIYNTQQTIAKLQGIEQFQVFDDIIGYSTFYSTNPEKVTFQGFGEYGRHSMVVAYRINSLMVSNLQGQNSHALAMVTDKYDAKELCGFVNDCKATANYQFLLRNQALHYSHHSCII